jgi:hypothetical protein
MEDKALFHNNSRIFLIYRGKERFRKVQLLKYRWEFLKVPLYFTSAYFVQIIVEIVMFFTIFDFKTRYGNNHL